MPVACAECRNRSASEPSIHASTMTQGRKTCSLPHATIQWMHPPTQSQLSSVWGCKAGTPDKPYQRQALIAAKHASGLRNLCSDGPLPLSSVSVRHEIILALQASCRSKRQAGMFLLQHKQQGFQSSSQNCGYMRPGSMTGCMVHLRLLGHGASCSCSLCLQCSRERISLALVGLCVQLPGAGPCCRLAEGGQLNACKHSAH